MSLAVVERPEWLQVEDAMADAAGFVNLANAQLVDVMVRALDAGVCSGGGFLSPGHWLTIHVGVTTGHGNEIVRIAEQAHEFPYVMALFRAGKLSLDQTATAMTAPPSADRRVAEFAEVATVPQIRKFVRTVVGLPEPGPTSPESGASDAAGGDGDSAAIEGVSTPHSSGATGAPCGEAELSEAESADASATIDHQPGSRTTGEQGAPRHSRSAASVSFGFDQWSQFWLTARSLTTDQGMVLEAALDEARDYLFRSGHPNVTWADSLVEVCRRSLATAGNQRAERFKTYIHINAPNRHPQLAITRTSAGSTDTNTTDTNTTNTNITEINGVTGDVCLSNQNNTGTFNRSDDSGGGGDGVSFEAILTSGIPIPASIRDYLTCDTLVQTVWHQGDQPIGVGRATRTPPNRLRRLLELRDQGCRVPGCTNTLGLQAHHIVSWTAGGTTELHNLVLVCDAHHHQHHTGDITIDGNPNLPHGQPGALTVTDQHGRSLRSHPTPRTPHPNDRPVGPSYKHPSGEPCNYRYLTWQPPPAT